MHKIDWCEGGLQLADITTKNVGENYLNPIIKYIMVRLDNWDRTLVQEGWHDIEYSIEQELFMTILDWVEDTTQSVWNFCREHLKLYVLEKNNVVINGKQCW